MRAITTPLSDLTEFNEINEYLEKPFACVEVTGELVVTKDAAQPFEIQAESIRVEGDSSPDYPLQKKKHSLEVALTSRIQPYTSTRLKISWKTGCICIPS